MPDRGRRGHRRVLCATAGLTGGTAPEVSWSFEFKEDSFRTAVDRCRAAGTRTFWDKPRWVGYWSFPVRDPMGNTVELTWPNDRGHEHEGWDATA